MAGLQCKLYTAQGPLVASSPNNRLTRGRRNRSYCERTQGGRSSLFLSQRNTRIHTRHTCPAHLGMPGTKVLHLKQVLS